MFQPGRLVPDEPVPPPSLSAPDPDAPPTGTAITLARGQPLFTAGEPAALHPFLLVSGALALSRLLPDGRRQIVDILGPGRLVGFSDGAVRTDTATALMRTHVRRLQAPPSAGVVTRELTIGLARLHDLALLLGRKSALEKVASALLQLSDLFGSRWASEPGAGLSFVLPLSRTDLGDWLGLVIETVSRSLGELQRRGVIAIERTDIVHIVDRGGLKALSGERATGIGAFA